MSSVTTHKNVVTEVYDTVTTSIVVIESVLVRNQ